MNIDDPLFSPHVFWDGDLPWPGVLRTRLMELKSLKLAGTPEAQVRALCQAKLPTGETLPPTKSLEVYHIRGIDGTSVPYSPVFAYLLDVGWNALPTVHIQYKVIGTGAPDFPNFSNSAILTTASRQSNDIIFPAVAGDIIFGVRPGTTMDQVNSALGKLVDSIKLWAPDPVNGDSYTGHVNAFREALVCQSVKSAAAFVRFAELNHLQRLIDFKPGWRVDRVA